MTALQPAPAAPSTGTPTGASRPGWWRRQRSTLLVLAALVLAVGLTLWLSGDDQEFTGRLDPGNPGPDGARAVARVLADEGVEVTVARSADELAEAGIDSGTTVVVTNTEELGERTLTDLSDRAGSARLVLVEPVSRVAEEFGHPAYPSSHQVGQGADAECDDPLLRDLTIEVDTALGYAGGGCFPVGEDHLVALDRQVALLGAGEALANEQVLRADNAAVALRLLGQEDRLVWYVPTFEDLTTEEETGLGTLLPRWLGPALWLAAVTMLAVVLWRGRRLGRLATEPLPVVVKAIETTRSRGRLYRKAGDREHAARALRTAARRRCVQRLRLGAGVDEATLLSDVARHTHRPLEEVAALLGSGGPVPQHDHDLIRLANDLAELDREVRHS